MTKEIVHQTYCADSVQTAKLIHDLQQTARAAGHDRPLLIALDQEHGMVISSIVYDLS